MSKESGIHCALATQIFELGASWHRHRFVWNDLNEFESKPTQQTKPNQKKTKQKKNETNTKQKKGGKRILAQISMWICSFPKFGQPGFIIHHRGVCLILHGLTKLYQSLERSSPSVPPGPTEIPRWFFGDFWGLDGGRNPWKNHQFAMKKGPWPEV